MNPEQIKRLATWAVTALGGALAGWGAARGYHFGDAITQLLSSDFIIGLVTMLITGILTWATSKLPFLVKVLDAFAKDKTTPIQAVVMTPTKEGIEIANSLPGNTTVGAGTDVAKEVLKP